MAGYRQLPQAKGLLLPVSDKWQTNPLGIPFNLLEDSHPDMTISQIDFKDSGDCDLRRPYVRVLDNVVTPQECSTIMKAIDCQSNIWEKIVGNDNCDGRGFLSDNRRCKRMMWDSPELGSKIWERIAAHVPELQRLESWPEVTKPASPQEQKDIWKMVRVNERVRFMKYCRGDYFKRRLPLPHTFRYKKLLRLS